MSSSEIKKFFRNQTVFLTGGTGFLGYLILEKLLRVCYDLKLIYVLVRDKKGKRAEERFDDIFDSLLFETLKSQQPGFRDKVKVIKGDCSEVGLGLSEDDRNLLKKEVNVVLHSAANVRFDQTLKNAAYNNVRPLMDLLALAKEMNDLKAFVHVSTAFSNCHQTHVKEEFYQPPMKAEKLLNLLSSTDDKTLDRITPIIVDKWQNTYIFTKSIGEDLVKREMQNLPICIVRPAIVMSTAEEPLAGWLYNLYGFGGVSVAVAIGALRTLNLKSDAQIPIVPCDYVSNTVLAAAWTTYTDRKEGKFGKIFNFAGSNSNIFFWRDYVRVFRRQRWILPTDRMIWYPETIILESTPLFKIVSFLIHTVPSYVVDFVLVCIGKPPFVVKIYKKIDTILEATQYFRVTSFKFDQANLEEIWKKMNKTDRKLFNFNMDGMKLQEYVDTAAWSARKHFLNDPPESVTKAKGKVVIFLVLHYGLFLAVLYLLLRLLWFCAKLVTPL